MAKISMKLPCAYDGVVLGSPDAVEWFKSIHSQYERMSTLLHRIVEESPNRTRYLGVDVVDAVEDIMRKPLGERSE